MVCMLTLYCFTKSLMYKDIVLLYLQLITLIVCQVGDTVNASKHFELAANQTNATTSIQFECRTIMNKYDKICNFMNILLSSTVIIIIYYHVITRYYYYLVIS